MCTQILHRSHVALAVRSAGSGDRTAGPGCSVRVPRAPGSPHACAATARPGGRATSLGPPLGCSPFLVVSESGPLHDGKRAAGSSCGQLGSEDPRGQQQQQHEQRHGCRLERAAAPAHHERRAPAWASRAGCMILGSELPAELPAVRQISSPPTFRASPCFVVLAAWFVGSQNVTTDEIKEPSHTEVRTPQPHAPDHPHH